MKGSTNPHYALWQHMANEHGLTLLETEIGDIVNLCRAIIATEQPDPWENAPPWAKYRTVDKDGTVTFWNMEPYFSESEGNWKHQNARVEFKEIHYTHSGWQNSLQIRPDEKE